MEFKKWLKLQEVGTTSGGGTGTGDIAMFKSRIGSPVRRADLGGVWGEEDPFFKKRRKVVEYRLDTGPSGQSLPSSPLKAQSNMATTNGQPTLLMPLPGVKEMNKKSKK